MSTFVRNLLGEQRKRAIGSLMRHIEAKVYPSLSPGQQAELRAKVIGSISQYHDTVLDIVKSAVPDGTVLNEEALVVLTRMEANLRRALREP